MKIIRSPRVYWLFVLLAAALISSLIPAPATAQSDSQVRIVRLSFVEGTVRMYRPDADQWAKAFVNTPIQQGFKIATDANSFAEIEFENGSTVRLGQSSELDFPSLALSPEGAKINHLTLAQGYATFAFSPGKGDVYNVAAAGSNFDASSKSMFRLDLDQGSERLEVFKGAVAVRSPYGNESVASNQVFELAAGGANPSQITNGITEDAWDRWVDKRQQTTAVAFNKTGPAQGGLSADGSLYGWSDLSYFGAWNDLPGVGSCWSPMMGADWAPYSIGRWSWYPGMGYTWISAMPWGWLPFHYGSWIYPASTGWCWLPGSFSAWSPALVTWYQGPGWVSWSPRNYVGGFNTPVNCPAGQNCSVAVSSNTFQGGRVISPNDVLRVKPFSGRAVNSPTLPLTRSLRLPGPAVDGPGLVATTGGAGISPRFRARRSDAAPTRVFSQSAIQGSWNVQPHAPAVFDLQTRRYVNRSGPALNNDVLLRSRTGLQPGNNRGPLTSIPIAELGTQAGTSLHSSSLIPSARLAGSATANGVIQQPRMPDFRQERKMMKMQQKMERQQVRREMRMEKQSRMRQQRMERSATPQRSSGGFGNSQSQSVDRTSGQMGGGSPNNGMGGGMSNSGLGGGMRGGGGGGGGQHGPPR
jgi:Family of unknown function (DUF6600)/FecR protein